MLNAVCYTEYNIDTQKEELLLVVEKDGVEYRILFDEDYFKDEPASGSE